MINEITLVSLQDAFSVANECHHDFELNILNVESDRQWAGWHASYVLGRLGDFVSPATLSQWLEDTPNKDNWSALTASYIMKQLEE